MAKRIRRVGSVANELVSKSREAMLTAVQIYNNPQINFKSELFIVSTVISWTYLLHAFYRKQRVEYRQLNPKPGRKKYLTTRYGAVRRWSLEQCLECKQCPLDDLVKKNIFFLIGIRHEIEHQMTTRIDERLSAKFMACALNFNAAIKQLFGSKYALDREQAFSIQFSAIDEATAKDLMDESDLPKHIRAFVSQFQSDMRQEDFDDSRYSYRVAFVQKITNSKSGADRVTEFVKTGSDTAVELNKVFLKETERKKYRPGTIIDLMKKEGYNGFGMHQHTELWKARDARNPAFGFGVRVETSWFWYESWVNEVRDYCKNRDKRHPAIQAIVDLGGKRIA